MHVHVQWHIFVLHVHWIHILLHAPDFTPWILRACTNRRPLSCDLHGLLILYNLVYGVVYSKVLWWVLIEAFCCSHSILSLHIHAIMQWFSHCHLSLYYFLGILSPPLHPIEESPQANVGWVELWESEGVESICSSWHSWSSHAMLWMVVLWTSSICDWIYR